MAYEPGVALRSRGEGRRKSNEVEHEIKVERDGRVMQLNTRGQVSYPVPFSLSGRLLSAPFITAA